MSSFCAKNVFTYINVNSFEVLLLYRGDRSIYVNVTLGKSSGERPPLIEAQRGGVVVTWHQYINDRVYKDAIRIFSDKNRTDVLRRTGFYL